MTATPEAGAPEQPAPSPAVEEYWGTDETHRFPLPDKVQYIEIKVMTEGERAKYQKMTNQDLVVQQDRSARVKVDPARDRHHLIISSVVDWYIFRSGQPVPFSKGSPGATLEQWLQVAPPKIVDDLEFFIRTKNPWMQADMSVEDIDSEIERLNELRKQAEEREAGEGFSANR